MAEFQIGHALALPFTPSGDITSKNVQDAIEELDTEKFPVGGDHDTLAHLLWSTAGHIIDSAVDFVGNDIDNINDISGNSDYIKFGGETTTQGISDPGSIAVYDLEVNDLLLLNFRSLSYSSSGYELYTGSDPLGQFGYYLDDGIFLATHEDANYNIILHKYLEGPARDYDHDELSPSVTQWIQGLEDPNTDNTIWGAFRRYGLTADPMYFSMGAPDEIHLVITTDSSNWTSDTVDAANGILTGLSLTDGDPNPVLTALEGNIEFGSNLDLAGNNIDNINYLSGNSAAVMVRTGAGTPVYLDGAANEFFVEDELEVKARSYFVGGINSYIHNNLYGENQGNALTWRRASSAIYYMRMIGRWGDGFKFAVGSDSGYMNNNIIICPSANYVKDFDKDSQSPAPSVYFVDNTDPDSDNTIFGVIRRNTNTFDICANDQINIMIGQGNRMSINNDVDSGTGFGILTGISLTDGNPNPVLTSLEGDIEFGSNVDVGTNVYMAGGVSGWTGTFTNGDGATVTVDGGIVTTVV